MQLLPGSEQHSRIIISVVSQAFLQAFFSNFIFKNFFGSIYQSPLAFPWKCIGHKMCCTGQISQFHSRCCCHILVLPSERRMCYLLHTFPTMSDQTQHSWRICCWHGSQLNQKVQFLLLYANSLLLSSCTLGLVSNSEGIFKEWLSNMLRVKTRTSKGRMGGRAVMLHTYSSLWAREIQ